MTAMSKKQENARRAAKINPKEEVASARREVEQAERFRDGRLREYERAGKLLEGAANRLTKAKAALADWLSKVSAKGGE